MQATMPAPGKDRDASTEIMGGGAAVLLPFSSYNDNMRTSGGAFSNFP